MQIDGRDENQPIKDLLVLLLLHCDAVRTVSSSVGPYGVQTKTRRIKETRPC